MSKEKYRKKFKKWKNVEREMQKRKNVEREMSKNKNVEKKNINSVKYGE
jgi:DNA repair ATPase RecN